MDKRTRLNHDIKTAAQSLTSTAMSDIYDKFIDDVDALAKRHRNLQLKEGGGNLYLTDTECNRAYDRIKEALPQELHSLLNKMSDTEGDRQMAYAEVAFEAGFYAAAALFKQVAPQQAQEPRKPRLGRRPRQSGSSSVNEVRACA